MRRLIVTILIISAINQNLTCQLSHMCYFNGTSQVYFNNDSLVSLKLDAGLWFPAYGKGKYNVMDRIIKIRLIPEENNKSYYVKSIKSDDSVSKFNIFCLAYKDSSCYSVEYAFSSNNRICTKGLLYDPTVLLIESYIQHGKPDTFEIFDGMFYNGIKFPVNLEEYVTYNIYLTERKASIEKSEIHFRIMDAKYRKIKLLDAPEYIRKNQTKNFIILEAD